MAKHIKSFFDDSLLFNLPTLKVNADLATDVYEKEGNVIVEISIPGMNPDRFDIAIENDHLCVSGSREESKETENHVYYHREITHGEFSRVIPLPAAVIAEKTSAEYRNGILKVVMPKKSAADAGRVKIAVKK